MFGIWNKGCIKCFIRLILVPELCSDNIGNGRTNRVNSSKALVMAVDDRLCFAADENARTIMSHMFC